MAHLKAVALKHHIRDDGSVRIKIRVTHNRKTKYIDTELTAHKSDLNKKGEIKSEFFLDTTYDIIRDYRHKINKHSEKVKSMDVGQLVEFLTRKEDIDFIEFANGLILDLRSAHHPGTASNYQSALNALIRFTGDTLPVKNLTTGFLREFETFIRSHPVSANKDMTRAPSLYMGILRAIHNRMKAKYNDEDTGIILVPGSPFSRYKIPREQPAAKRALSIQQIRELLLVSISPDQQRAMLALDCFILSFCLIGMNSADLYYCTAIEGNEITYNRRKTASRRDDKATMKVIIQPEIMWLVSKYLDQTGKRVFNFYQQYSNHQNFNKALNIGLKSIMPGLEFYAARHSWATIARNNAGIDMYTVHAALNHVDESMRVTDLYIQKDYKPVNDANRLVLDLVFYGVSRS